MANTKMDNYIDSLEKGQEIEFEGDLYEFIKIEGDYILCDNLHYIFISDFHDDLENGENHLFHKFNKDEEIDKQTNAGMESKKV